MSAMVRFDFEVHPELDVGNEVLTGGLRRVVRMAFQQRRKVLRNSLRGVLKEKGVEWEGRWWEGKRPEELTPIEFLNLTKFIYKSDLAAYEGSSAAADGDAAGMKEGVAEGSDTPTVWRSKGEHSLYDRGTTGGARLL